MKEFLEYIPLTAAGITIFLAIVPIVIKEFFKSPAEIFISSNYGKIINRIVTMAFLSFCIVSSASLISTSISPDERLLAIGFWLLIFFLLVLLIGGIGSLMVKNYQDKTYKWIKRFFLLGSVSFIVAIVLINSNFLNDEDEWQPIISTLVSEYLLFLSFLLIFSHISSNANNTNKKLTVLSPNEAFSFIKGMHLVEVLPNGIRRVSFSSSKEYDKKNTLYFFHTQSGLLEIINEETDETSLKTVGYNDKTFSFQNKNFLISDFRFIIWNKKNIDFFKHIKKYYNFEKVQSSQELIEKQELLKLIDIDTLKRAKIRAESAKVIMNPVLMLAGLTILLQALIFAFNDNTGWVTFGIIVAAITIIVSLVTARREYLIASHFIHYVSECIEEYGEESQ